MQNLQSEVRVFLTFLVAGLSTAVATVNNETFRIVAGCLIAGLASVGIIPPHISTVTAIPEDGQPVNVLKEDGLTTVELLLALILIVAVIGLLFGLHLAD